MWRRIPSRLVATLCSPSAAPAALSHGSRHYCAFSHQSFAAARTSSIPRMQTVLTRQLATASSRDVDAMWVAAKKGFERFMPKNGTPTGAKAETDRSRDDDNDNDKDKDKGDGEKKNEPPPPHILMGAAVVALLL
jgi:hypothetical protein